MRKYDRQKHLWILLQLCNIVVIMLHGKAGTNIGNFKGGVTRVTIQKGHKDQSYCLFAGMYSRADQNLIYE